MWPTRNPATGGNYDLKQAILIRAGAHSFEGKVFNVVASGFLDSAARDRLGRLNPEAGRILDGSPRGISVVMGPEGTPVSQILQDEEGLLYAEDRSLPNGGPQSRSTTWWAGTTGSTSSISAWTGPPDRPMNFEPTDLSSRIGGCRPLRRGGMTNVPATRQFPRLLTSFGPFTRLLRYYDLC